MSKIPGYELHKLQVNASDAAGTPVHLAYYDTGIPASPGAEAATTAYRTLVIMHGLNYSSPIFERLLPLARFRNLRIVLVDRRGYGQSTEIAQAEVERCTGPGATAEDVQEFIRQRGCETARFLIRFSEEHRLPSQSVTLLTWSIGNRNTLGLLAALKRLSSSEVAALGAYLTSLVMWEPPYHIFDFPIPPGAYNPILDEKLPKASKARTVECWLSGYFDHKPGFDEDYSKFEFQYPSTDVRPSVDNISLEESQRILDLRAMESYELAVLKRGGELRANTRLLEEAFTDKHGAPVLSGLKITAILAEQSLWEVILGPLQLQRHLGQYKATGGFARPVEVVQVPKANHFLHWDDPALALETFLSAM